jgi:rhodanese-related sulfurtransferase
MTTIRTVDANELRKWLDNNEAILIDVREPVEYDAEHILEAIHIPLGNVTKQILPSLGSKKLVVHCMLGKRGSVACAKLLNEDPNLEIYNLNNGLSGWKEAGLPIVKTG